jgi:hypothetical protein
MAPDLIEGVLLCTGRLLLHAYNGRWSQEHMMRTFNPARFEAVASLLAQPDPTDLPRRSHVYRCLGDPNRRTTRFPEILMGWLQRHYLDIDVEEPLTSAARTWRYRRSIRWNGLERRGHSAKPGLRVLRPTGTD